MKIHEKKKRNGKGKKLEKRDGNERKIIISMKNGKLVMFQE